MSISCPPLPLREGIIPSIAPDLSFSGMRRRRIRRAIVVRMFVGGGGRRETQIARGVHRPRRAGALRFVDCIIIDERHISIDVAFVVVPA
jgi:hypothetical protein